ncbi:MAG TPA: hypothetical protein VFO40_21720 [Chthoniobacterales bacterium]|jgi:hypothetical protein|nr:hypothetical protein [Chthoniobacterales bacterium]
MLDPESVLPDLQASVICEDVRQEVNGMQTLVGIINLIPARMLPVALLKLCVWTRWCGGFGRFRQNARILGVDDQHVLAESQIDFELKELEGNVTNVNLFTGVQFQQYGLHHVEIMLDQELRLRYPLPVIQVS